MGASSLYVSCGVCWGRVGMYRVALVSVAWPHPLRDRTRRRTRGSGEGWGVRHGPARGDRGLEDRRWSRPARSNGNTI